MTVHRAPGTVEATLAEAIHHLPAAAVEKFTGKSPSHFYKVSNPGSRWELHLKDAAKLDAALITKDMAPRFLPLLEALTYEAVNGKANGSCLYQMLHSGMVILGDLTRLIEEAHADGRIDLHESRDIAALFQSLMELGQQGRDEMKSLHDGPRVA